MTQTRFRPVLSILILIAFFHQQVTKVSLRKPAFEEDQSILPRCLNQPNPTLNLPAPTTLTATPRLARAPLDIPTPNLLTMPTQSPHPPLPIQITIIIPLRHLRNNNNTLKPPSMPFAYRLCPPAVHLCRHESAAKDAFPPSAEVVAALCDVASDGAFLAFGGGFDVVLGWRGELEEELFGGELEGYEA